LFVGLKSYAYICKTLKKALSILLAVLVLSQMMVNTGIGVYYHLNKEYIAKQLCVNKNNPSMHCDGHCYLSKQLKKAEQGEKQSTQSLKEKDEIFSNNCESAVVYFPSYHINGFIPYITSQPCAYNYNSLIKPPAA
jgi:hypothetical protein